MLKYGSRTQLDDIALSAIAVVVDPKDLKTETVISDQLVAREKILVNFKTALDADLQDAYDQSTDHALRLEILFVQMLRYLKK
jgi:hypothetical protein